MGKDYYKILGLEKTASEDDIKKAFRKLAHEHHPDKKGGNEAKFKEASEAYSVLSDAKKRKQYDTFGSAGPGGAGFNAGGFNGSFNGFDFSQFARQYQGQNGQSFEFDLGDLFGDFFGGGGRRRPRKGPNVTVDVELSFKDSVFGTEHDVSLGKDKLTITVPPGIESGQGLRIAGRGEQGEAGPGDLIVRVWVKEHPVFRKEGLNLVMELPLRLTTALAGGSVDIDSLDGKLEVKIPAGTSHGEILRVKGKGVPYETRGAFTGAAHQKRGDLLIVTRVEMPKRLSKKAQQLVNELKGEGL